MDINTMADLDPVIREGIKAVNQYFLHNHSFFSTNKRHNYEKFQTSKEFQRNKKHYSAFCKSFLVPTFFDQLVALGFSDINPKEKEVNALTQTVWYDRGLMQQQANRQEHEFEREWYVSVCLIDLLDSCFDFVQGSQPHNISASLTVPD